MQLQAIGHGFRVLIKVIAWMLAPVLATSRVSSGAPVSRPYRQCDPSASGNCCLRVIYPDEEETGIIRFPGYASSRPTARVGTDHGAA